MSSRRGHARVGYATGGRAARSAVYVVALLLAVGCASGPTYEQLRPTMPAIASGQGRIFVYLPASTAVPANPQITIDDELVGVLRPGTFLSFDRPEGAHVVGVHVKAVNVFGQGATEPVEIPLLAGETAYVSASANAMGGLVIVTLTRVAPDDGERDLAGMHLAPPPEP